MARYWAARPPKTRYIRVDAGTLARKGRRGLKLSALIAGLEITPADAARAVGDPEIASATDDSRAARPGCVFVARAGAKHDGRAYIDAAVKAGAAAIIADAATAHEAGARAKGAPGPAWLCAADPAWAIAMLAARLAGDPTAHMDVVGITGTNGKTTTAALVQQLLSGGGRKCGLIGTIRVDDGRERRTASLTTPSAVELAEITARMKKNGCEAVAMEASSHALHQRRVAGLHFRVGVFTNLTRDHLDYHATMEAYGAAKAMLFESLPANGTAIVNADDPAAERMVRDCKAPVWRARVRRAGERGAAADLSVAIEELSRSGMRLAFDGHWGRWRARVGLVGAFNAANVLHAAAAAHALGMPPANIAPLLERADAPPGRLESVGGRTGRAVYVDYAHTPDALERAMATCREILESEHTRTGVRGRLVVVFGCGGERDPGKRPMMGALASAQADVVIVTSDNPRSETPEAIVEQIVAGAAAPDRHRVTAVVDRAEAIRAAVARAGAGDIVLIAGKGHEDYQIMPDGRGGSAKRHFDDREEARAALAGANSPTAATATGSGMHEGVGA